MYSTSGVTSPPQLDPQALQSTPVSFARQLAPPGAPRLPRSDDDPPLLLDEDPPMQAHTSPSVFGFSQPPQPMHNSGPQQSYSLPQNVVTDPVYPFPSQFSSQPHQQVLYNYAPQEVFPQHVNPESFYQQPPISCTNIYQPSYNSVYPHNFGYSDACNLSLEKPEILAPPSWDMPTGQTQVLPPYQLTPLTSCEFDLHISSYMEEIRQHNASVCSLDSIQARVYEFPPLTCSSSDASDHDDITSDTAQQLSSFADGNNYCVQENQMKLETHLTKMQQDREDQERMIAEKRKAKAERREQRKLRRQADRQTRKQMHLERMQQKHEKNLKQFAVRFSAPPLETRLQSADESGGTITATKSIKVYSSEAQSEKPKRLRNLVLGNGYGRLFWPGYIDLSKEHGTSTVKIGLFGLEVDGFLNKRDMFLATQTELPGQHEQSAYVSAIEETIKDVPGMQFWGCDPNNGIFYTVRSRH